MASRKAPIESATKFKVGTKKKGPDEYELYIVEKTKSGVRRWVKHGAVIFITNLFEEDSVEAKTFWKFTHKILKKYKYKWIGGSYMAVGREEQFNGYYKHRDQIIKEIRDKIKKDKVW